MNPPLGWFETESGEWSCDPDDLPFYACNRCKAECLPGEDYCAFHLAEVEADELNAVLIDIVRSQVPA